MLSVKKLTKKYGNSTVVDQLNLSVKKGSIYGLIGPNGAGKSTTIACILGLKQAETGEVKLLNQSVRDMRGRIGVQFQNSYYPEKIKVIEMIEMMEVLYPETIDYHELLKKFGLKDKKKQYVSSLSGGEQQKLSVLLALINKPDIVFLDELTTGLDPHGRREVWRVLKSFSKEGMTIFMTSHFMDEVEHLCDCIHVIDHGKTVFKGTVQELLFMNDEKNIEQAYLKLVKGGDYEKVH